MQADINDIIILLRGCEIAIYKKVYTKEELDILFPVWNNLTSMMDKIKRQQQVETLYRDDAPRESN